MQLCLTAGLISVFLGNEITLTWQHSVEKIIWQEDYVATENAVVVVNGRVRGTGAGMEIPKGAVQITDKNSPNYGAWQYQIPNNKFAKINLTHSQYTAPYSFCNKSSCKTINQLIPNIPDYAVIELTTCKNNLHK